MSAALKDQFMRSLLRDRRDATETEAEQTGDLASSLAVAGHHILEGAGRLKLLSEGEWVPDQDLDLSDIRRWLTEANSAMARYDRAVAIAAGMAAMKEGKR